MQEIWKDIPNYENLYQISNLGNIRSLHNRYKNKTYLKPCINSKGYLSVSLCKDHTQRAFNIHRLVAEAFIPNPNNYPCVNHIDEDKTNNHVSNLEWCSYYYNNTYGHRLIKSAAKRSIPVMCVETKIIYSSATDAQRKTSIRQSHICRCCRGQRITAGGYQWCYAQ